MQKKNRINFMQEKWKNALLIQTIIDKFNMCISKPKNKEVATIFYYSFVDSSAKAVGVDLYKNVIGTEN